MSTNQETHTLDDTLEKTDLGHVINENKKLILVISGIVLALIVAYSVFSHMKTVEGQEQLDKIFEIEQSVFTGYLDDETKADEFKQKLLAIDNKFIAAPNLIPSYMAALNKLEEEDKLDQAIMDNAREWTKNIDKTSDLFPIAVLRMAALLEDQSQSVKALQLLENLKASNPKLFKDKIYFELGRIYVSLDQMELAKQNLDYVIHTYPDSEYAQRAKLYLSGI